MSCTFLCYCADYVPFFVKFSSVVSDAAIITQEQPVELSSSAPPQDITASINEVNNCFKFSSYHGGQVAISHDCRSAVRINPLCEFNNAIVMSHRPLKDDELFEVIVEKLVSRWSGSMEAGLYVLSSVQCLCTTAMKLCNFT